MIRFPAIVAATFAIAITTAAYAHAAPADAEIAGAPGQTLTLTGAKQMVSAKLAAAGQRNLRPGHAEFDGEGNVSVEIETLQGLPVSHVVVHADNGMVTDARTGRNGAKG
jgi:hypothetical protein